MSRGVNKVILVGNLGQDPELKQLTSGTSVVNVSLATSQSWKDKATGEQKERTEWHRLCFFHRLADIVAQFLRKGSQIYVEGRIQTRKWQDDSGQDRYATEIVVNEMQMLGAKNKQPLDGDIFTPKATETVAVTPATGQHDVAF